MSHPYNPLGPFKSDPLWLTAFVVHSLCNLASKVLPSLFGCIAVTVVCLCTDHPAAIAASLNTLFKAFSR